MHPEQKQNCVTNADLLRRLEAIEEKLDQAAGAWWFVKLFASCAVGTALLWNTIHGWFR